MSMTTIGALNVLINADNKSFKSVVKDTQKTLKKARKSLNDNAVSFAKWSAAGITASAGISAAIFKDNSSNIRELKNLSAAANEVVGDFQRGAFAAQQFGIEQDKYGDILKDVNDRIGDFVTTGGGPMLDFFEQVAPKIGITADAFRGLSGQDALGLFVKSLEDANLSQEEMTFHMEALAGDATLLLPLFQDNAKALNRLTEEARSLGVGLSAIDVEKVEQANRALDAAGALIGTALQEATVELSPVITAVAKQFKEAAIEAGGFGDMARDGINEVINAIGFGMDAVEGIKRTFQVLGSSIALVVLGIEEGMLSVADFIVNRPVQAVNELIDALNTLPWHNIDPIELSGFGETIETELGIVQEAIRLGVDNIAAILAAPMPSVELKKAVEEARVAADELAKITEEDEKKRKDNKEESPRVQAMSSETAAILAELQNRYASELDLENEKFIAEQEAIAAAREANQITDAEHMALIEQNNQEHLDRLQAMEDVRQQNQLNQAAGVFGALATIMSLGGKKTEKAVRALSIATAIIKGHESAVAAYAAGMSIGGPTAPATAALYAAASIAQTGMMIARLKSGSKSTAKPTGSTPQAATSSGGASGSGSGVGTTKRIDINIGGEGFFSSGQVRQLIEQINEQLDDGVQLGAGA